MLSFSAGEAARQLFVLWRCRWRAGPQALALDPPFGFWRHCAATTEAPPRPTSRRGRIPKHVSAVGTLSVPLCLPAKASPFWIILLLVWPISEHHGARAGSD